MLYEKEYIKHLISESENYPEIKPILEDYLLCNIDFNEATKLISKKIVNITPYKTFKKSIDIDNLLN